MATYPVAKPHFTLLFITTFICIFQGKSSSWLDIEANEVVMVQSRLQGLPKRCDLYVDSGYEKWKWMPNGCSLPRFDALKFLGKMRRKRIMLVGDSIMRNQWENLVCLVQGVIPTGHKKVTYNGLSMAFHALDLETSIEFSWAPLLVKLKKGPVNERVLRLDLIEENARYWRGVDTDKMAENVITRKVPFKFSANQVVVLKGVLRRMRFPVYLHDIMKMSAFRRDGHPSVYRRALNQAQK
ncbi:putative sodium/metabolite cotransporter BASS4 [Hibiscus syriacus]|uniref:Sodium/metabolite cotransporter BASS4 n=1 Tax=Hibiscus syriacus TaxID=106335 RepID=A0A6A3ADI5_HIBSY|nr:putative sodium/metabolite cotransporter BASS4 [Hibiscus syriacus]